MFVELKMNWDEEENEFLEKVVDGAFLAPIVNKYEGRKQKEDLFYNDVISSFIPPDFVLMNDSNDEEEEQLSNKDLKDPTAEHIWPSALLFLEFLAEKFGNRGRDGLASNLKDKRILELGAGTGFLGMILSTLGAHVTITDLPDAVSLIGETITKNSHLWRNAKNRCIQHPFVKEHTWGDDMDAIFAAKNCYFDYVVGTDLLHFGGWDVFAEDTRQPLLQSIHQATTYNQQSRSSSSSCAIVVWVVRLPEREESFILDASSLFQKNISLWKRSTKKRMSRGDSRSFSGQGNSWVNITDDFWAKATNSNSSSGKISPYLRVGQPICLELWF